MIARGNVARLRNTCVYVRSGSRVGGVAEGEGGTSEGVVHRRGQGRTLDHHSPMSTEMTANSMKCRSGFSLHQTNKQTLIMPLSYNYSIYLDLTESKCIVLET